MHFMTDTEAQQSVFPGSCPSPMVTGTGHLWKIICTSLGHLFKSKYPIKCNKLQKTIFRATFDNIISGYIKYTIS